MGLSREEIVDLASKYTTLDEAIDFPYDGDVFCILVRTIPEKETLSEEEGWVFRGYGICIGYTIDEEAKTRGKWLWMHFAGLDAFPPVAQVLKLQPPHVVKGRFQNANRSQEVRIIKVGITNIVDVLDKFRPEKAPAEEKNPANEKKIVQFRKKTTKQKS